MVTLLETNFVNDNFKNEKIVYVQPELVTEPAIQPVLTTGNRGNFKNDIKKFLIYKN